jgi:hypothetical protein
VRLPADLRPDPHDPVSVHLDTADPAGPLSIVLVELIARPGATGSDTDDQLHGSSGVPAATPRSGRADDGALNASGRRLG